MLVFVLSGRKRKRSSRKRKDERKKKEKGEEKEKILDMTFTYLFFQALCREFRTVKDVIYNIIKWLVCSKNWLNPTNVESSLGRYCSTETRQDKTTMESVHTDNDNDNIIRDNTYPLREDRPIRGPLCHTYVEGLSNGIFPFPLSWSWSCIVYLELGDCNTMSDYVR